MQNEAHAIINLHCLYTLKFVQKTFSVPEMVTLVRFISIEHPLVVLQCISVNLFSVECKTVVQKCYKETVYCDFESKLN